MHFSTYIHAYLPCGERSLHGKYICTYAESALYGFHILTNIILCSTCVYYLSFGLIKCSYQHCIYSNNISCNTRICYLLAIAAGHPPNDVTLYEVTLNHLTFIWSENNVLSHCPLLHYRISASPSCGLCPNTTVNTTATCLGDYAQLLSNSLNCSFAIQTIVCGDISGVVSEAVNVMWSDVNVPTLKLLKTHH